MTTPGYNTGGQNISGQFGMPLYGVGGWLPFTGNYYWVDQTNGSDGNTGGPQDPFKTLSQAHSKCIAGNNDVVFLTGNVNITSTLVWSKNKTHLVGLAPTLDSQARSRISAGGSVFSPYVSVTAAECIFMNTGVYGGFNSATTQIAWADTGQRNFYSHCNFLGMADATAAGQAGGRSLTIGSGGNGEHTFLNCTIGLDTITRSTGNASLEFLGGSPRNVFRNCIFPMITSSASAVCVTAGAAGLDRFTVFDNCTFCNTPTGSTTTATAVFTINAGAGGDVLVQGGLAYGFTNISASGPVRVNGAVPDGNTSSIAVSAS